MRVLRLWLQWNFKHDVPLRVHFEQARALAEFGHERVAVVEALGGADLAVLLAALIGEHRLVEPFPGRHHLLHPVSIGEQHVAVGQHEAIARTAGIFPLGLSVLADDGGLATEHEIGMLDGNFI